jgi:hypothetical protein
MSFIGTLPANTVKLTSHVTAPVQVSSVDTATGSESVSIRIFITMDSANGVDTAAITVLTNDQSVGSEQVAGLSATVSVSDSGQATETAQKTYAELISADQSTGADITVIKLMEESDAATAAEEMSLQILAIDKATAAEEIAYREFTSSDTSSAIDLLSRKEMALISDLSSGSESSVINLNRIEIATGIEIITFERGLGDVGSGIENRLSPIPVKVTDTAQGLNITFKTVKFRIDGAVGSEIASIILLVHDNGAGSEAVPAISRMVSDLTKGSEIRLSPIPLLRSDAAIGHDVSLFSYRELQRPDATTGIDATTQRTMIGIADGAAGIDTSKINKVVADSSIGTSFTITLSKATSDLTKGSEIRLSPIPLLRSDAAIGHDTAWFYWWEGTKSDTAIGKELPTGRQLIETDRGSAAESMLVGLARLDSATGTDRHVERDLTILDSAAGIENRLSPIPVKVTDTAQGLEVIIYRVFARLDLGAGIDLSILEMVIPPISQSPWTTISSSKHQGYTYTTLAQESKASIMTESRGVTAFSAALGNSIKPSISTSTQPSTFAGKKLSNIIKSNYLSMSMGNSFTNQVAVQDINVEKTLNMDQDTYTKTSLLNEVKSTHTELENSDRFNSEALAETIMYSYDSALYNNYIPPILLEESGKLIAMEKADISTIQTFLSTKINDSIFLSSPPVIINRANQFLTNVVVQQILMSVSSSNKNTLSFISKSIFNSINLSMNQEMRELHAMPIVIDERLILSLIESTIQQTFNKIKMQLPMILGQRFANRYTSNSRVLVEIILRGMFSLIKFVTSSFQYLVELQSLENGFRHVNEGDEILQSDHNLFVNALQLFATFAERLTNDRFSNDSDVNIALENLKDAVSKLRIVKSFDVILPDDHNQIVESIEMAREFIKTVRQKIGLYT